jgi:hypothetical protein
LCQSHRSMSQSANSVVIIDVNHIVALGTPLLKP